MDSLKISPHISAETFQSALSLTFPPVTQTPCVPRSKLRMCDNPEKISTVLQLVF